MAALLPASMRNIRSKMKSLSIGQHFHHYKYMEANFRHSDLASNAEVNSLIWPKFKLTQEFMAVLATCKFDKDLIKIGTIDRTRSNMGFFSSQGQVTSN